MSVLLFLWLFILWHRHKWVTVLTKRGTRELLANTDQRLSFLVFVFFTDYFFGCAFTRWSSDSTTLNLDHVAPRVYLISTDKDMKGHMWARGIYKTDTYVMRMSLREEDDFDRVGAVHQRLWFASPKCIAGPRHRMWHIRAQFGHGLGVRGINRRVVKACLWRGSLFWSQDVCFDSKVWHMRIAPVFYSCLRHQISLVKVFVQQQWCVFCLSVILLQFCFGFAVLFCFFVFVCVCLYYFLWQQQKLPSTSHSHEFCQVDDVCLY